MKNYLKKSLNLKRESKDCKFLIKLGYSHPIYLDIPESVIKFDLYAKGTIIYIQGIDKEVISILLKNSKF